MSEEDDSFSPSLPSKAVLGGIAFAFFLLTFFTYGSSLNNNFVQWDDGLLIYENPIVREMSPRSIKVAFSSYDPELYIPLTILSYQIDYLIGGTDPFIAHLGNLILHTLNALLVTLFLYLISRRIWVALFCGILFAVHPLHTEAVAWASARKDVLSTFFFLSSLVTYLYYRCHAEQCHGERSRTMTSSVPPFDSAQDDTAGTKTKHGSYIYFLSLASFLLGLLSKVSVITLPVVLLLLDYFQERKITREVLKEKLPFFVLSLLFGVIALYGKWGALEELPFLSLLLLACKSTVFYIQKLLLPINLSVLYPYTGEIALGSAAFFVPLLILFALLVFGFWSRRSLHHREIVFGLLFFFITLIPTFFNLAKDGDIYFASDRYAYIPSIGFLYLLILLAFRVIPRLWAFVSIGFIVVLFAGMAYAQSAVWRDSAALFQNVIAHYPNSHRAHNNLGNVYRLEEELELAVTEFKEALAISPRPKTHSNLGAVYRKEGRIREALAEYRAAIALDPGDPEPYFGLGIVYASRGDAEQALSSYRRALDLDPLYAEAYTNIGALFAAQGRLAEAILQYELSISTNPFFVQAYYNLGIAAAKLGQNQKAITAYEEAVRLRPDFIAARINLGILYYDAGDLQASAEEFQAILSIDPTNAAARAALQQMGE